MELDPDRRLALSYVSAARRPAVDALWQLDLAMGAVLTGGREPMISRIKLAWWREALEALDRAPPPAEPALQALAAHALPAGVTGAALAQMEDGWAVLLSDVALTAADLDTYAQARGGVLFRCSALALGVEDAEAVAQAGEAWALVDLARHSANLADADAAVAAARARLPLPRVPGRLRPLSMLGALAARDAEAERPRWEQQGAPGRMLRMLRHRITGL
jgi:phytoene synthase